MDWFDLLAIQGTFKSLPQHHSSKPSIIQCSVFFIVQLSHPYMTTGKTVALDGLNLHDGFSTMTVIFPVYVFYDFNFSQMDLCGSVTVVL